MTPLPRRWATPAQLAATRDVLEQFRRRAAVPRTDPMQLATLNRHVAAALGTDLKQSHALLRAAGIQTPLEKTITADSINQLLTEAMIAASPPNMRLAERARARAEVVPKVSEQKQEVVRTVFRATRWNTDRGRSKKSRLEDLISRLVSTTGLSRAHVGLLLRYSGIREPLHRRITEERVDRLLVAATTMSRQQLEAEVTRLVAEELHLRAGSTTAQHRPATEPATQLHGSSPRNDQPASTAGASPARTASPPNSAAYPACRRLVQATETAHLAHTVADIYLTLAELSSYRSSPQSSAVAAIAANRFGVHTDSATGRRLNVRASEVMARGDGPVQLDHLSRLDRRLRGVFYDGHRDRVTAWDSSEGDMALYTCTGAELRTAAQVAVDYGDLTLPRMRRQVVNDTYEPAGAEDPALVLAVAAEQLGRQAAQTVRIGTEPTSGQKPQHRRDAGHSSGPDTRTVSAANWVHPVSGDWGELVVSHLDASYTRHTLGPRSRAATVVREHKRRAPGTSKTAEPTITVRSHPRRGTGPDARAPKVTKVSGRRQLWR